MSIKYKGKAYNSKEELCEHLGINIIDLKIQLEVYKDIEKAVDKSIQRAGLINQYKNKAKSSTSNRIQNAQYVNKLKKIQRDYEGVTVKLSSGELIYVNELSYMYRIQPTRILTLVEAHGITEALNILNYRLYRNSSENKQKLLDYINDNREGYLDPTKYNYTIKSRIVDIENAANLLKDRISNNEYKKEYTVEGKEELIKNKKIEKERLRERLREQRILNKKLIDEKKREIIRNTKQNMLDYIDANRDGYLEPNKYRYTTETRMDYIQKAVDVLNYRLSNNVTLDKLPEINKQIKLNTLQDKNTLREIKSIERKLNVPFRLNSKIMKDIKINDANIGHIVNNSNLTILEILKYFVSTRHKELNIKQFILLYLTGNKNLGYLIGAHFNELGILKIRLNSHSNKGLRGLTELALEMVGYKV